MSIVLLQFINAITYFYRGGKRTTNTQAAIKLMREDVFSTSHGDRNGVANVAIIVTDGFSNVNPEQTIPEATKAKDQGIQLYTVSLMQEYNLAELNAIASDPDNNHVIIVGKDDIQDKADDLAARLCQSEH